MKLEVKKMGINGEGIAYDHKIPVFIKGALTDEVVDVTIIKNCNTYKLAKLNAIIKESQRRQKALCPHYKECGACSLMHLKYGYQLEYKKDMVLEAFKKYADYEISDIQVVGYNEFYYRNSLKVHVINHKGKLRCGFYSEGSNYLNLIDDCMIHEEGLNNTLKIIMNVLNKYGFNAYDKRTKRGIRSIFLRKIKKYYELCLVTGDTKIDQRVVDDLLRIDGLKVIDQSINKGSGLSFFGKQLIHLTKLHYLDFSFMYLNTLLSNRAFFQLNTQQAINLYQYVINLIKDEDYYVFEAYAGIGIMGALLAKKGHKVVANEIIPEAISSAKRIQNKNKLNDIEYILADAKDALKTSIKKQKMDVILVDPPRSGLDDEMIESIIKSNVNKVVYISCNPSTLAKNYQKLSRYYQIQSIKCFDMFPNTQHVECIALIQRRKW